MANSTNPPFTIGIVLYPDFDPLDVAGPLDRFTPTAVKRYSGEVARTAGLISKDLGYNSRA